MSRVLGGLHRPDCLSRFGRAASVSLSMPSPSAQVSNDPAPPSESEIRKILDSPKTGKKSTPPSASFLAISRKTAEFVTRNKTNSPDVGKYHPNYDVGRLRTDRSPVYTGKSTSPRDKRILLPACLTQIEVSYPRHARKATVSQSPGKDSTFEDVCKRTISDLKRYSKVIHDKDTCESGQKPDVKVKGLVSFDQQLIRPEFVNEGGPPHPERFNSSTSRSLVLSSNKRVPEVSFEKGLNRRQLFNPKPLPDYRPNTRLTRRGSPQPLKFENRPGRKSLALEHMVKNPPQVDQKRLDKCWELVQASPGKIPKLVSLSPRDDLMYRTTELYKQNVPHRQLASDVPMYQGDLKDAYSHTGQASAVTPNITIYL